MVSILLAAVKVEWTVHSEVFRVRLIDKSATAAMRSTHDGSTSW